jgi:hypothetical protein
VTAPVGPLKVVQMGIEATRGTAVAATAILDMAENSGQLNRSPSIIRIRNAGSFATSHRTYPGRDIISVDIEGPWTYNWAPNWFNLFLGPLAAGTGAGADKVWAFTGTANTVISDIGDNLKSATLEVGGKDTWPSEYQLKGCVGTKLELTMAQDKEWRYKATLLALLDTPQAKTAALAYAAGIVDVLGTTTKVYLNTTGTAFGTTQKVGSVLSGTITIDVGANARYTLDSLRSPFRVSVTGARKISAKIVAEYDGQAEYTATHAATAQRVRVKEIGPVLGGSTYICQLDLPGTWDTFTVGKDGDVITEEMELIGQYDAVAGTVADVGASVTTSNAALL